MLAPPLKIAQGFSNCVTVRGVGGMINFARGRELFYGLVLWGHRFQQGVWGQL